jgi:tetratricopeptide (TPR) repeat protein
VTLVNLGRVDEAIADFTQAIQAGKRGTDVFVNRGAAYLRRKDVTRAIADCDEAIKINDKCAPAFHLRGTARSTLRQWEAALPDFQKAVLLSPTSAAMLMSLAHAQAETDKWDKASSTLQSLVRLLPRDIGPVRLRALVQLHSGDAAGYRQTCAGMLDGVTKAQVQPSIATTVAWTCALLADATPNFDAVVTLAQKGLTADPKSYVCERALGIALLRAGKVDVALEHLHRASELQKRSPSVWCALAIAHHRTGHSEEARRWYEKAVSWLEAARKPNATLPDSGSEWDTVPWFEKIALDHLQKEAEAAIKTPKP